ncbi:hypothetical protein ACGTN9_12255 [Halobacillus sp. MO56]
MDLRLALFPQASPPNAHRVINRCKKKETKNSELKHRHGYEVASFSGLEGMRIQGAMAIFTANVKRIVKLMKE